MRIALLALSVLLLIGPMAAAQTRETQTADLGDRLEIRVPPDELERLRKILRDFAVAEGLTVDDLAGQVRARDGRPLLMMDLSRSGKFDVTVSNVHAENRIFLWVHDLNAGTEAKATVARLRQVLAQHWPNIGPYKGL